MHAARMAARRSALPKPTAATPSSRSWKRPPDAAPPSQVETSQIETSRVNRRCVVTRRVLVVGMVAIFAGVTALCTLGRVWADDAQAAVDYTKISPMDLVKNTPKGKLTNPYKDTQADIVAQGGQFMLSYSCSGCHGGGGGGGMCPPLTNDIWVYGGDDATLFLLVTLGSDELQTQGYMPKGRQNLLGPIPP